MAGQIGPSVSWLTKLRRGHQGDAELQVACNMPPNYLDCIKFLLSLSLSPPPLRSPKDEEIRNSKESRLTIIIIHPWTWTYLVDLLYAAVN